MSQYSFENYSINLENYKTFIKIKIINNITNYFFEKDITTNDITLDCLNKYYSLVQNCLLNKPGFTIRFNEYSNKIDMVIHYETDFLDIDETVILDKYSNNEIEILQNQIIAPIIPSRKIQIGYVQKIIGSNLIDKPRIFTHNILEKYNMPRITKIEKNIIEFDETIEHLKYEFEEDNKNNNDYIITTNIIFDNFVDKFTNLKIISTNQIWRFCNKYSQSYSIPNSNHLPTREEYTIYYNNNLEVLTITNIKDSFDFVPIM